MASPDVRQPGATRVPMPFAGLTPEVVLAALEQAGLHPDGRFSALNSYENRVYQLGVDPEDLDGLGAGTGAVPGRVVAKFYRPGRWSDAQILEEHEFGREMAQLELPVAAALEVRGTSLHRYQDFRFAVFDFQPGHAPELDAPEARQMLGRALGRMHAIGATRPFRHRERLDGELLGSAARNAVLDSPLLPEILHDRYASVSEEIVMRVANAFAFAEPLARIRLHGDCHLGNILWSATGPRFVDLDDCLQAPRIQDLWMFLSGSPAQQQRDWAEIFEGYSQFTTFDASEMALVEPLRGLRMLRHAAWIAARWRDPAFPRAFPYFGEPRFWEQHLVDLMEQIENLDDPPLLRVC